MPLPASSKPGETMRITLHPRQSSMPKHAIVVRLNPEALNALDSFPAQPQVDIDLNNDNPALYIGNSLFPVRFQKEEISHEVYIRAATANKLNAPLRCHANVVGKLSLTDRELDPDTAARIKMATKDAREQRDAPKTKYIDTPLELPSSRNTKKKMSRKPVKQSDQPRLSTSINTSTIASHQRPSHHPSSSQISAEIVALRKQIIHYLARSDFEPSVDDVLRAVGPEECDIVTRRKITDALGEVAEQNPKRMWALKPNSWLEVRPYEWPKLSESERFYMAHKGRTILTNLGVSESDPTWIHLKYRNNNLAAAPIATTSAQSANGQPTMVQKRGISSKDAKEKKARSAKMEAKVKDEGRTVKESRAATTSTLAPVPNKRTVPVGAVSSEPPTRPSPTSRKPPGSGFKLKASDSSRRSESLSQDGSPAPTGPSVRVKADTGRTSERSSVPLNVRVEGRDDDAPPPKRVKRLKEEPVESERDYDAPTDKSREHDRERDRGREPRKESGREKERENERDRYRERERERERGRERGLQLERGTEREREKERIREKNKNQRVPPPALTVTKEPHKSDDIPGTLKRKKPFTREDGGDDDGSWNTGRASSSKKQRLANDEQRLTTVVTNGGDRVQKSFDRPQKLVKNASGILMSHKQLAESTPPLVVVKKERIKKETSPFGQLPKIKKESPMPTIPKASSTLKSTSKSRRKSPIYTSSEAEDESAVATSKDSVESSSRNHTVMPTPPLPTPTSSHFHGSSSRNTTSSSTGASGVTLPTTNNGRSTSPLPTDHASLRARYRTSYLEYLDTFRTAMTQKSKIENLLQSYGEGSVASFSDSDGDELLDYDRLTHVVGETKRMWEELQGITLYRITQQEL